MAKILVVDDSQIIRTQLKSDLTEVGHEIVEADNGVNGLRALSTHSDIDIVICDVNMPEMDGLSMCAEIHQDSAVNHIPLIMLTTQCSPEMKQRGKDNGVVAWIIKPYKPKGLIDGISRLLARSQK